jgi:mitochondrial fission protein ELM1
LPDVLPHKWARVFLKKKMAERAFFSQARRELISCDPIDPTSCNDLNAAVSAPTFAVEAQYQWLLGARQYTAVAIGGGAKRFYLSDERAIGISRVTPTLRLTIGYAF